MNHTQMNCHDVKDISAYNRWCKGATPETSFYATFCTFTHEDGSTMTVVAFSGKEQCNFRYATDLITTCDPALPTATSNAGFP